MHTKFVIYSAGFLLTAFSTFLSAQTERRDSLVQNSQSLFKMQYFKEGEHWLSTNNAAGLSSGTMNNYSDVNLSYKFSKGDFRRAQQPNLSNNYLFSAEGAITMNKYYLIGGFNFKEAFERDIHFTSILDSYRGTPYIIADSTGGNWKKQTYDMWVKIASPVYFNLISFGIDGKLAVGRGAKNIDPRPQANSNSIQVSPSFTLTQGRQLLGMDFSYRRFRENSNMILYDTGNPQKIYFLKGMGQYTYDVFSTNERERQYNGNGFGGGAQYVYKSDRFSLFLNGAYENYVEDANDIENSKPRERGRLYETSWKGNLHLDIYNKEHSLKHTLFAGYNDINRSGREIIQVFNSSSEVNAWITDSEAPRRSVASQKEWKAGYNLFLLDMTGTSYKWKFSLNGTLSDYSDEYAVMDSYLKFKSSLVSASALRNFSIKKSQLLQVEIGGNYRCVGSKQMQYTPRETEDKAIENGLINKDANILTQNYYQLQANVLYGYNLRNNTCLYLKASYMYLQTEDKLNRNVISASIGCNF
ncbi:DUF6850 family outer membrane beta-barrel protein [uncultured Bacteroides sp.]|uniref:DUF6850 family outer membrane beta-barrel protein n=1 Tax=uncultured Bacteroides sp. TaxID=162156 RepID=UPI002AAC0F2A|nr:DUF6850 family outer membrane beta-barrel protein [uncultured Bacteroides sp.]